MTMYDPYGDYANLSGGNALSNWANQQAQAAYYNALASGQSADRALAAAKFEWQKQLDTAGQTGKWNGQWNNPQQQWFTGQFGQWFGEGGAPTAGQQTLAREGQTYNQQQGYGSMYGQYYAPGTAPLQGTQNLAMIGQQQGAAQGAAALTGWYNAPVQANVNPADFTAQDDATRNYWLQWNENDPTKAATAWATASAAALRNYAQQNPDASRQRTLSGQEQDFTQNLRTEQEQRAAQAQTQSQTQAYLQLLSQLRGPADWAKYQQVLGSTPNGMRDLYAAAMGQYVPGGGATTGMQPQAASLQSMMGQVAGQPYSGQGGGQLNQPSPYQGGQGAYGQQPQANSGAWPEWQTQTQAQPYQAAYGQQPQAQTNAQQYPGGQFQTGLWTGGGQQVAQDEQAGQFGRGQSPQQSGQAWGSGINVGQQPLTAAQQQQATGNGSNTNMPLPNQVAPQSWRNFTPTQQQMMLGQWEAQGWDKNDVTALMNQSLPKYGTNAATAGTWRL